MRITLNENNFNEIIASLKNRQDLIDLLMDAKAVYELSLTDSKKGAWKKAHLKKKENSTKKILSAVKKLVKNDAKITVSSISKTSGLHYQTVQKNAYWLRYLKNNKRISNE